MELLRRARRRRRSKGRASESRCAVFLREKGAQPFWQALHASKDPLTYTVLGEDFAALAGLAVAAIGIFISHQFDMPKADGVASVVIGVILAGVAVLLIREARDC